MRSTFLLLASWLMWSCVPKTMSEPVTEASLAAPEPNLMVVIEILYNRTPDGKGEKMISLQESYPYLCVEIAEGNLEEATEFFKKKMFESTQAFQLTCKKQSNERGQFHHCVDEVYAKAAAGGWNAYRVYTIEDGTDRLQRCHDIAKVENNWLNQEKMKEMREENIKERERLKAKAKK